MMKTIHDVYKYNRDNNLKMLSDYPSDFWSSYRTDSTKYDKVFERMFMSFRPCFQNDEEEVNDIANNFREDVYNHLLMNDKKYSELYRVQVIPDTSYSLTDNYDVTETLDKNISDSNDNTYGARTDTVEETEGSRTDEVETVTGTQSNDTTHKVAPYDSSDFSNNTKDEEVKGARTDTEELSKGQQINETESVKGSQNDVLERTYEEDYTLHRKGNIGVMTVSDMLKKHKQFWDLWSFYEYIFKEICKELLLI